MKWKDAILKVLAEEKRKMSYTEITEMIFNKRYRIGSNSKENAIHVNSVLTTNPDQFRMLDQGVFELIDTPATAPHTTVFRTKCAKDFIEHPEVISSEEQELLELIVNFPLPLVNGEVCFADIMDKLEVKIVDKEKILSQSIDATLLQKKLDELKKQIEDNRSKQHGDLDDTLWKYIYQAQQLCSGAVDKVILLPSYLLLGKFVSGKEKESKPKVVIYLKSIEKSIKDDESRESVMAAVFVHEMFHAWNYFNAERTKKSVMEIDEAMVEFETLYFLKELDAYTRSQFHSLRDKVSCVRKNWESRVQNKQQSIGDVAAYGFGYYLFKRLNRKERDSKNWIETYSKKSASINGSYPLVENAKVALTPIYPFKSESKVMGWFKKIIFDDRATSKTVGKPATAKVSNTTSDVIYKIRVNRPCRLFIDDEELMTLKENELTKITLPKGEYLRKVVAEDDTTIFDEKVISLFHPKVDDIALDAISLEEAKRNALPDEFFQGDLCFKPTKDRLSVEVVDTKEYVDTINIPDQIKYAGHVYPVIRVQLSRKFDLKSITISDGVKRIIIDSCSSLTSIIIPNSLTSIGNRAFEGCTSLKSITIPNSVTWIGEHAFYYCTSLASVTIPNSVTEILDSAFADCNSLTTINYAGTKEQWEAINKGRVDFNGYYREYWKEDSNIRVVHCTDGDIKL